LTNSSASFGLDIRRIYQLIEKVVNSKRGSLPIRWCNRKFLVYKFTPLLKDKMTSLRFSPLPCSQSSDQDSLWVRNQRIRKLLLLEKCENEKI
jgi:hypothetical protein